MLTKLNHDKSLAFKLADRQAGGWMEESDKVIRKAHLSSNPELSSTIIYEQNHIWNCTAHLSPAVP